MAFKVPRARRRFEDPTQVQRGQAVAPTAGTQAEQQLGRAIVQAGVATAQISNRILTTRARVARETALNRSNSAANLVEEELTQFIVDEFSKRGSQTEGSTELFKEAFTDSVQRHTADFSEQGKLLTNDRLSPFFLSNNRKLAEHQSRERRAETTSNLDQFSAKALLSISNDPTEENIVNQRLLVRKEVSKYAEFIGQEGVEDRVLEFIQNSAQTAVSSLTLQDPEAAQALLDETKAVLSADIIKTLEADIRKQTKLQKDEQEAVRKESVESLTKDTMALGLDGAATETLLLADPRYIAANSTERKNLQSIVKKSSPYNKSDEPTRAEVFTRIRTAPDSITQDDLDAFHARPKDGISTDDYNIAVPLWKAELKKIEDGETTAVDSAIKRGYVIFNEAKNDNVFDSNSVKNLTEWSRTTQAFEEFIVDNPKAPPKEITDFAEQILIEVKRGFLGSAWDLIRHPILFKRELGASEDEVKSRRAAIVALTAAGEEITEANIIDAVNQLEDAGEL